MEGTTGMRRVAMGASDLAAIRDGRLRHALVPARDPFRVGMLVLLDDGGPGLAVRVTYVTSAEHPCALSPGGLAPGHAILSLEPIGAAETMPAD